MQPNYSRLFATLLALTPVCGLTSAALAQRTPDRPAEVRIGLLGGASLATVVDRSDDLRLTYRDGVAAGIMAALPLASALALQSEILYVQKGAYSNFSEQDATFAQDYVELPLLLRLDLPVAQRFTPFVVGGPSLSLLTRCRVQVGGGPVPGVHSCNDYHGRDDYYHRLDYGLVAGTGLAIHFGRETIALGTRYEWGLRSLGPEASGKRRDLTYLAALEWRVK